MKGQLRIDTMYAFIVLDIDGTEGVPAMVVPGEVLGLHGPTLLPMMGADLARIDGLRAYIQRDPMLRGKKITLAKFSVRENLDVIDRTGENVG